MPIDARKLILAPEGGPPTPTGVAINGMRLGFRALAGGQSFSWSCPSDGWSLYDIYEPAGRYLGQVKVPERVEPIVMRGDYVWAATCNKDDVPQVVRYRINWR